MKCEPKFAGWLEIPSAKKTFFLATQDFLTISCQPPRHEGGAPEGNARHALLRATHAPC